MSISNKKQIRKTTSVIASLPDGVIVDSLDTGSTTNAPSVRVVKDIDTRVQTLENTDIVVVEDSLDTGSTTNAPSVNAVRGALYKPNLLINGDFQVWQRGENFSGSLVANGKYCADRWRLYNTSNSNLVIKKVDNGISFTNVNSHMTIYQPFEDSFFDKHGGKEYTLTRCVNGVEIIKHGTIPTENTSFVAVEISTDCIVNYVKLEIGSIATPFVPRLYVEELLLCQRYYYRLEPGSDGKDLTVSTGSHINNNCLFTIILPTILRVAPSVEYSNVKTHNNAGLHDVSKIGVAHSQASSNITALEVTTSIKASSFTIIHLRVVKGGYLALDAEIY